MTCVFRDLDEGPCGGRVQWHHAIKQQRLRREFPHGAIWAQGRFHRASRHNPVTGLSNEFRVTLDHILGDRRNCVWICSDHHERVTNSRLRVELPASVWEFAREFGLEGMLQNDLDRQKGAA